MKWYIRFLIKLLPKVWKDAGKAIEKQNLVTKALEQAFQQEVIQGSWDSFLDSVISWLEDGLAEAKDAKSWREELPVEYKEEK